MKDDHKLTVEKENTVVRPARVCDAASLLDIYAYYVENTAVTFEYDIPSVPEFEDRMRRTMSRYPYLVIEHKGQIRGYAYAGVFKDRAAYDRSCEMTIYLDHDFRNHGFGRKLYEALENELERMGMLNLYACIGYPAVRDEYLTRDSERFHRRLGYETVGRFHKCGYKFGRWYDMIWMEKIIGNRT